MLNNNEPSIPTPYDIAQTLFKKNKGLADIPLKLYIELTKHDIGSFNHHDKNIFPSEQGVLFNIDDNLDAKGVVASVFPLKDEHLHGFAYTKEFSRKDIEIYFSIYIFHCLNRLANIEEFWSKPNSVTQFSFFNTSVSYIMSFSKFKAIHRTLHYEGFGTDEKKTDKNFIYKDVNKTIGQHSKRIPGKADRVESYEEKVKERVGQNVPALPDKTPIGQEILN
ncbi:hypothetical protein ACTFIU_006916 [Dictyostelium citrinum]